MLASLLTPDWTTTTMPFIDAFLYWEHSVLEYEALGGGRNLTIASSALW